MKLGFNAGVFGELEIDHLFPMAREMNFSAMEINCSTKEYPAPKHLCIDTFDENTGENLIRLMKGNSIGISCLSYYSNPLASNDSAESFNLRISRLLEIAATLGVGNISTFTGYRADLSISDNIELFARIIRPLLKTAKENRINILIENTPVLACQSFAGNFAYSPEIWDSIFTVIPDENFGLNYDPSHLFWLGIDYMMFLKVFSERIFHFQAKDSEILVEHLRMTGILGQNWFRYRIPGQGSIEWKRLLSALYEIGYDGCISIEHEDPTWQKGLEQKKKGLLLGKKSLEAFII